MPRIVTPTEEDAQNVGIDVALPITEQRAQAAMGIFGANYVPADLTDGGVVEGARIFPMENGKEAAFGRPAAWAGYMWDGTPTTMTLAWNPDGTMHDGARRYLLKRHCMCCGASGFRGKCRVCSRSECTRCQAGNDRSKNIRCNYLWKHEVPYPREPETGFDCFLRSCSRRGDDGFGTEELMRTHARTKHRLEYAAYLETQQARRTSETDQLRNELATLRELVLRQSMAQPIVAQPVVQPVSAPATNGRSESRTEEQKQRDRERMAKARAARKKPPKGR